MNLKFSDLAQSYCKQWIIFSKRFCQIKTETSFVFTISYLIGNYPAMKEFLRFSLTFSYLSTRLRSVRQDLVIQQLQFAEPEIAINVLEKCFQFYAYSDFVIKRNPKLSMNSHLNRTHMQECLSTLLKIYIECLCDNYRVGSICKNCSTYIACNLLYNLGSEDALLQALKLPKHVRQQIPLSMAFNISFKYIQKNFVGIQRDILDLIEKDQVFPVLSFLSNVDQFRADSIRILTVSHNSKRSQVPATVLKKWLFLDNEDRVIKLCVLYGMKATEDRNVVFVKSDFVIPDSFFLTDSYIPLQRVLRCLHD